MLLKGNRAFIQDSRLTLTAANFAAQTIKIPIPRVSPYALEWIVIMLTWTQNAAVTSGLVGHGFLNLLKRVVLGNIPNAQGKPSNIIDVSGAGLLNFVVNEGFALDRATMGTQAANSVPNMVTTGVHRICYAIPCAPPFFTDGLRPRCLLPIQTYNQDPILQMDFAAAAEMSGDSNPFTAITPEVFLIRREMPDDIITKINASGGFFNWDLLETQLTLQAGVTNALQKVPVPTPGSYTGLLMYHLLGGATQVIGDLSGSTTVGSETEWQLKGAGKDIIESFRMKHLQVENDWSRPTMAQRFARPIATPTAVTGETVPNFGGSLGTGNIIQNPGSVYMDFVSDGITDVRELGSMLDTTPYAAKGLEVALYGNVTTSATTTQPSLINLIGRRFYGDLSQFQLL